MYKVEIGGLVVQVESVEQLREVIQTFGAGAVQMSTPAATTPAISEAVKSYVPAASLPVKTPKGARYAPTEVKIRSENTQDALLKFYKSLAGDNANHRDAFLFLAEQGDKGASAEGLKEALGMPPEYKLGGLTSAIRRRAPHFGLEPEQILIVEYRGIVGSVRILDYRLGPEMLEVMKSLKRGGKEVEKE